ncbi:ABC transporter ATP-binding protein [Alsobacter metallidurans]|uniref:ABC transporter ATP-binding protein n=1 Tax=Alsobacter metallidurans TaxID=340221 RepID=A0A917I801_9HYPH|nr:ABC transporter ATP-binding protein [Alsobacter metallidurans]GGH20865.1 ABC transporter ATP-binding protein [Alsobacter metallidurans]
MPYIALERLTKRYGDHLAVDALDLAVEKGEFISLLGPSGCGKTTTLQMIAGFVEPTGGRVMLDGVDLGAMKPNRRGLGIVFQSYALFPHMTAAENVAFGLEMRDVPRAEREKRVAETLALVGLSGFADRYPKRMSGGQQQRVALARALVIKPAILLLDEPLSNLDAKLREEMQIELRSIQRISGATTILVTHDQAEAMALSDRIVLMNKGRVEQIARPDEAYARPASAFVANFLGKTNLLNGAIESTPQGPVLVVGGLRLPAPAGAGSGPQSVAVRPERIAFASGTAGVSGRVTMRVFQGLHWLLQVDSEAGPLTLVRPNDGSPVPAEGETVALTFSTQDFALLPAGDAP